MRRVLEGGDGLITVRKSERSKESFDFLDEDRLLFGVCAGETVGDAVILTAR
jgi:hypothetical protein